MHPDNSKMPKKMVAVVVRECFLVSVLIGFCFLSVVSSPVTYNKRFSTLKYYTYAKKNFMGTLKCFPQEHICPR